MATKGQILEQINNPNSDFTKSLSSCYSDTNLLNKKILRLREILQEPALDHQLETVVCRCPGRISFSKHADYINSDLLYTLDDRDIFVAGQIIHDTTHSLYGKLTLINRDASFSNETILFESNDIDPKTWCFYPQKIWQALQDYNPRYRNYGIVLVYSSDLPPAGGLSSSHALMISTLIALTELLEIEELKRSFLNRYSPDLKNKKNLIAILRLLQRVEHQRGFNSGLGDQSAELLSKKNQLSFIKIEPDLEISYQDINADLAIITAPSLIKADKSLPEFQAANQNIKLYKEINTMAQNYGCNYLADLIYKYPEAKIFEILTNIIDIRERGLALYGLSEAARIKNLKENFSNEKLGKYLNLSHQAEKNFRLSKGGWQAIPDQEKLAYEFNSNKPLAEHSGIYLASTLANDQLQTLANSYSGVYGSSISGAGLGGNNIIVAQRNAIAGLRQYLIDGFYNARNDSRGPHLTSSSAPATRIF